MWSLHTFWVRVGLKMLQHLCARMIKFEFNQLANTLHVASVFVGQIELLEPHSLRGHLLKALEHIAGLLRLFQNLLKIAVWLLFPESDKCAQLRVLSEIREVCAGDEIVPLLFCLAFTLLCDEILCPASQERYMLLPLFFHPSGFCFEPLPLFLCQSLQTGEK